MQQKTKNHIRLTAYIAITLVLISSTSLLYAQTGAESGTSSDETDHTEPSDVEDLKALPGDSEVQLSWNAATDNVSVTGYKIYRGAHSVKTADDSYDLPVVPVENVTSYSVKNLTNGQAYYFSITALDAAGNESVNYATEATATPKSGLHLASIEDDGKPPQVNKVEAEDTVSVKVTFSEPVKLPEEHPSSAFQIERVDTKARLEVQKADIDARDDTGKTVLLTTSPQEENVEYVLTAGIEFQDYFNNPVVSGTSDTGSFKGSAKKKQVASLTTPPSAAPPAMLPPPPSAEAPKDTDPPTIINATADFSNRITVNFSEPVELSANPTEQFTVYKGGTKNQLKVINVSLSVDSKTAYITTDPQEGVDYEVNVSGVKDLAGNAIESQSSSVAVKGMGTKDVTPPEDVTKLIAKIKDLKKHIVTLKWQASKNTAKDLDDQVLYQSESKQGTAFDAGVSLGSTMTSAEVRDLKGGQWYTFKVTAKDTSGNESKGAVVAIYLPNTGPGLIAAGLTSLLMGFYSRRRKKK